jgi:hypothetical protein
MLPRLALLLLLCPLTATAAEKDKNDLPNVFSTKPETLASVKRRLADGDRDLRPSYDRLIEQADRALKQKPLSVMDKANAGPSGDKHDYASYAPYFWPNPKTEDGLPYIRKDGQRNHDAVKEGDHDALGHVLGTVQTLSLAYYLSGNERYADHAALLLRTWFLDPKTRMNPHFDNAQIVRGENKGRGTGLIEFAGMPGLVDSLGLLERSKAWTDADRKEMRAWLEKYAHWLATSKNGKDEKAATNNHGTWYDVQSVSLALYLGHRDAAKQECEAAKARLAKQIEPDGRQPRELTRADSFSYSVFNLRAWFALADLAERVDVDLWHYEKNGRSLHKALDFLLPYLDVKAKWPTPQKKPIRAKDLIALLRRGGQVYRDKECQKWLDSIAAADLAASRIELYHPR